MRLWSGSNRRWTTTSNLHCLGLLQVEVVLGGCLAWVVAELVVCTKGLKRIFLPFFNRVIRWSSRVHSLRMIRTIWLDRGQELLTLSMWAIWRITDLISCWRGCWILSSDRQTTFIVSCCHRWGGGLGDGCDGTNSLLNQALWFSVTHVSRGIRTWKSDLLWCTVRLLAKCYCMVGVHAIWTRVQTLVPVLYGLKRWLTLCILSEIYLVLIDHVVTWLIARSLRSWGQFSV